MGSSSSKVARTAASTARRQYPSTSSIPTTTSTTTSPAPSPPPPSTSTPRTANAAPTPQPPSPAQVHPSPTQSPPSTTRTPQIDLDGADPQFNSRLSRLGPVRPVSASPSNASMFPPSTQSQSQQQTVFPNTLSSSGSSGPMNPALRIVEARERIAKLFEAESESLGRSSFQGRTLIGAAQIRDVLGMRESGMESGEIERRLRLKSGVVRKLGIGSVVENA